MRCRDHNHHKDNGRLLELSLERLKTGGLKLTRQRQALVAAAIKLGAPFTAEEIRQASAFAMDLVTTYRSLSKFVEAGVFVTCDFGKAGDNTSRYELAPVDQRDHHHHIICTVCQRVDPVPSCRIQGQDRDLRKLGYQAVSHKLEFFGICPACAKRRKA